MGVWTGMGIHGCEATTALQTLCAPNGTAASVIDPVLVEGACVPGSAAFFAGQRERADRYGILLIVDETQTGRGGTGRFRGGEQFQGRAGLHVTAKGWLPDPLCGIAASAP